jgi:glycosyltransferase involved in cell wall biosynthesis
VTTPLAESAVQVSVIIPAYNRAHLLADAVNSVLAQDINDIEIIVVDDGSNDNPDLALAPFGDRVQLLHKANGGVSSARNRGLDIAKGRYIAYLDSDDIWSAGKLSRYLELFDKYPEAGFIFSNFSRFSVLQDGREYSKTNSELFTQIYQYTDTALDQAYPAYYLPSAAIFECLASGFFLGPSTLMLRAELQPKVGAWDEAYRISEDLHYLLRLAALADAIYIDEAMTRNGRGEDNLTQVPMESAKADIQVLEQFRGDSRFSPVQRALLKKCLSRRYMGLGYNLKQQQAYSEAQAAYLASLKNNPANLKALANMLFAGLQRIRF